MTQAAVSEDIRTLLNDNALGVEGTDLFSFECGTDNEGEEIDSQTLIIDTEPFTSDLKDQYEQPTFAILVRGVIDGDSKTVYDKIRAIIEFLIVQPTQTINTVDYLEFEPIAGVAPLGKDKNSRFVYSMNFYTFRNPI